MNSTASLPNSQKGINQYYVYSSYNINKMKEYCPEKNTSLFIPCIPIKLKDENVIRRMFERELMIGKVKRVDFVPKNKTNDLNANRWEVFVHFESWYDTYDVKILRDLLEKNEYVDIVGTASMGGYYNRLQTQIDFVRLMFNKTPIKETSFNAHQLADLLEREVKKNKELEDKIRDLEEQIKKMTIPENK